MVGVIISFFILLPWQVGLAESRPVPTLKRGNTVFREKIVSRRGYDGVAGSGPAQDIGRSSPEFVPRSSPTARATLAAMLRSTSPNAICRSGLWRDHPAIDDSHRPVAVPFAQSGPIAAAPTLTSDSASCTFLFRGIIAAITGYMAGLIGASKARCPGRNPHRARHFAAAGGILGRESVLMIQVLVLRLFVPR